MTNKHGAFIWYELLTKDPDASAAFYGDVIGWTSSASGQPGMDYWVLAMNGAGVGGMMQLTEAMCASGARPLWLAYIGVDDVDAAAAAIAGDGGTILMAPQDIPGVGRFAMFADRQGIPAYVMKGSSDGTSTAFSPSLAGHCSWNELRTSDQADALAFYARHFDWVKADAMPMGEMGDYQFITHHGTTLGAVMTAPVGAPAMWNYYFRVADIDAAIARATKAGATIVHGPVEVPGGDHIINALDPQGAAFSLVGQRH